MRRTARILLILCSLGWLAFTLYAGRHNRSIVLVALFAVWVALPLFGLLRVLGGVERATQQIETKVQMLAIVITAVALTIYAVFALRPAGHNAAAPFLLVPALLWLAIGSMSLYVRRKGVQGTG
jgi:tryptophan-rich sensory protein